jgi:hypothetical protein
MHVSAPEVAFFRGLLERQGQLGATGFNLPSPLCAPRQLPQLIPLIFEDRRVRPRRPKTSWMKGRSSQKGNESGHDGQVQHTVHRLPGFGCRRVIAVEVVSDQSPPLISTEAVDAEGCTVRINRLRRRSSRRWTRRFATNGSSSLLRRCRQPMLDVPLKAEVTN